YDKAYNLTAIADSLRGSMFNTITANDQISHATWTGDSSQFPLCEELFTYDKNLNITRRQTRVNEVLESETHQQNRHGRVISSEHEGWRHSTHRINPQTGKPEEGKFVRVVNAHNVIWKYDVNGRLVQKLVDKGGYRPLEWRYRWDARSQLTGLETPDGERWEYKYDPFGRRISKRCTSHNKPGMDFHWNGDQLTEEISVGADGKPEDENAIRWIYEPGSFTPVARYEKGQLHYAVTDTVGRIQELLTEEGLIVWKGKQQLWGREEGITKEDAPTCRLRFPGQYEDAESGLYYNRFRYYDCETGQYISSDPSGLDGGINPYGYVYNPLECIDPFGLAKRKAQNTVFRYLSSDDLMRYENGQSLLPKGEFGSILDHVLGKDTGHISASLTKCAASRYDSGNGYIEIDIQKVIDSGISFIDHNNVMQAVSRSSSLDARRNADKALEVLFKGEIPFEAIIFKGK
ncbi:TPA: hypothetical protein JZ923_004455, partial [Escherichia coli]|nr:hypothetical protein [Escherichia coli]